MLHRYKSLISHTFQPPSGPHWDFNAPLINETIKAIERLLCSVYALESPSSSKLLGWMGVPLLLRITAVWTHVPWIKSAQGRHGLFVMDCYIPHRHPRDCAAVWERGGGGVTHAAPPLSSWHLTYWCRGSQLEQTRCAVSQLQCLSPWLTEQTTGNNESAPISFKHLRCENKGVVFKQITFLFPVCSPVKFQHLMMLFIPWKSFLLYLCKDIRKRHLHSASGIQHNL